MVKYCMNGDGDYEDYADDDDKNLPLNPRNNLLRLRQQEIRQERLQLQQPQQEHLLVDPAQIVYCVELGVK